MDVHEPRFGGYDFVFVDQLSPGQTCPICLVVMRNPVQTTCGHRFCEDCLLGTFRYLLFRDHDLNVFTFYLLKQTTTSAQVRPFVSIQNWEGIVTVEMQIIKIQPCSSLIEPNYALFQITEELFLIDNVQLHRDWYSITLTGMVFLAHSQVRVIFVKSTICVTSTCLKGQLNINCLHWQEDQTSLLFIRQLSLPHSFDQFWWHHILFLKARQWSFLSSR